VSAVATRTQLEAAIDILRDGDKLVVTKLDRLARNVMHMGDILQQIEAKGAGLVTYPWAVKLLIRLQPQASWS
jgi:DNA invertase Pin-like site-specific DNA recombinase